MKTYELKSLTARDLFPMMRIISKFGISEFKQCFNSQDIAKLVAETGDETGDALTSIVGMNIAFDIASIVLTNVPKCEDEIYTFLAQISNLTKKEIEKMPAQDFLEMILDVIMKDEFKDFFGRVLKLMK